MSDDDDLDGLGAPRGIAVASVVVGALCGCVTVLWWLL